MNPKNSRENQRKATESWRKSGMKQWKQLFSLVSNGIVCSLSLSLSTVPIIGIWMGIESWNRCFIIHLSANVCLFGEDTDSFLCLLHHLHQTTIFRAQSEGPVA